MIWGIFVVIIFLAFLVMLNGSLRGAAKERINAILSLLLLGCVVASFFAARWFFGLIAIALAFVAAAITQPLAARLASKVLSRHREGTHSYIGSPSGQLARISRKIGSQGGFDKPLDEMMADMNSREQIYEELLDYCESQSEIKRIMNEFQVSRGDLKELYDLLVMAGAGQWAGGHWVAASAIAYPESLKYILNQNSKATDIQIMAYGLIMYFESGTALED